MFNTEGVFLLVVVWFIPKLNAVVSANANSGLWQLAQETEESFDNIFSLNSNLPSLTAVFFSFSMTKAIDAKIKMMAPEMKIIDFLIKTKKDR
jgi:hypothetical protein